MTLFDFSQSIKSLNREKKFPEALAFFRENKTTFTIEQIGFNKYIIYEMISALIETNNYQAIFVFIKQYNVVLAPTEFSYLLKKFKDKPSINWPMVAKFCDLVAVDSLNIECKTIEVERKGETKLMELASERENWYAIKTKALFETQQYQQCFELSKKALESFETFHYSNEIWFARRIALSKKQLGNSADALNELLLILKRKKEWFIQNEVAVIYKENGNFDEAFKHAIDGINNFGNLEYKVGLLVLIADILNTNEKRELAFKHYMLSKLLRFKEEWPIPQTLNFTLQSLGYAEIPIEQLPNLKNELRSYWNSFKVQQTRSKGRIDRILHNDEKGADGFIKYDNNKSIYFRVNATDELINRLCVDLEVTFKILPPKEDGKKERAVNIKPR